MSGQTSAETGSDRERAGGARLNGKTTVQDGLNRIDAAFDRLRRDGRKGLIAYITAGDPSYEATGDLVLAMERAGADLIELGVPFSDPMADGPVIQQASMRALAGGTTLTGILSLVRRLREHTQIPLLLMTYYNPVLHYGLADFAADAAAAGVDGLIVPDLSVEESGSLLAELLQHRVHLIPFAAPTSTPERLARVGGAGSGGPGAARGFIYCVSLTGVTGAREGLPPGIEEFMQRVRVCTDRPLAIGFGIASPAQAALMSKLGDAVIVGSAIVSLVEQYAAEREMMLQQVSALVGSLKQAISQAG
ncbi:MAG: tryptophan synthase subunit alpha [Thermacetogeniaceae bacterium]|jgi:tryptophan synthase alpha chain